MWGNYRTTVHWCVTIVELSLICLPRSQQVILLFLASDESHKATMCKIISFRFSVLYKWRQPNVCIATKKYKVSANEISAYALTCSPDLYPRLTLTRPMSLLVDRSVVETWRSRTTRSVDPMVNHLYYSLFILKAITMLQYFLYSILLKYIFSAISLSVHFFFIWEGGGWVL